MTGRNRRNFSPWFRHEAAQLVLEQHYTVAAAAKAMNVGKSTMDKPHAWHYSVLFVKAIAKVMAPQVLVILPRWSPPKA
jgi:hypothetical protein